MLRVDREQLKTVDMKKVVEYLIEKHKPIAAHASYLQAYYEGYHAILNRQMADSTKPNNKLVNNLASYITDTVTGYFMGKPVAYSSEEADEEYLEELTRIFDYNDEQDHNSELGKSQSIKGVGYELLYTDDNSEIRFAELALESTIYVETDDVAAEPALAIHFYRIDNILGGVRLYYDVYTDIEIITYELVEENDSKSLIEQGRREHYWGGVPVIAYPNNKEMMGDFEGVISLIDEYNQAQSDTANDFEYFTDAYLMLTGVELTDPQVKKMRENRTISLPDKECMADWLIKEINDVAIENYKDRVREDIHSLSKTPNLNDESFAGNLTGIAISYKLWGLEQIAANKERKFKRALQRRIELITNLLNSAEKGWNWMDIKITFSRNMPQNLVEIVEMVTKLRNQVPEIILLAQLPFIENPKEAQDMLEKQNMGKVDLYEFEEEEEEEEEEAGEVTESVVEDEE